MEIGLVSPARSRLMAMQKSGFSRFAVKHFIPGNSPKA